MRLLRCARYAAVTLVFLLSVGWKLPGAEHQSSDLHDWATQLQERDIEGSRVENPKRRASQDKWTGLNAFPGDPYPDDLLDMENTVWPHFPTNPWNMPDWGFADYPDPEETHVGSWWGSDPGSGGAWRVCRPEAGGYYIECGTCEDWWINQPSQDILELTTFSGQGNWTHFDNSLITVCAYAGAEDGQEITVGYTQIPVVGGKMYPETYCEKTYYVQCEDCVCQGAVPPIYGDASTIHQDGSGDNTVDVWVGSSMACGPFEWAITGTGAHFNSTTGPTTETTTEELEVLTVYADSSACGTFTITVTDDCGVTDTAHILVEEDSDWVEIIAADVDNSCDFYGVSTQYAQSGYYVWNYYIQGRYKMRQKTGWQIMRKNKSCGSNFCLSYCTGNQCNPCLLNPGTSGGGGWDEYVVPCQDFRCSYSGTMVDCVHCWRKMWLAKDEWKCTP